MKRLLIIRFSAMGDVTMAVPVVHCLAKQHPDLRITILTQEKFAPLYSWTPSNVEIMGVNLKKYKSVLGLERLYQKLKEKHFDAVADLHDVLRTQYLRMRFKLTKAEVAVIDKGRAEKKALLGNGTAMEPLRPVTQRYADVFQRLGLTVNLDFTRAFDPAYEDFTKVNNIVGVKPKDEKWIGIAPFAAHEGKIYPLPLMREVVKMLSEKGFKTFLFGAGEREKETLASWEGEHVKSICGKFGGLHDEMLLMSRLDLMIAMDSSNMHMASIIGIPTLSIWGATHPKAGFVGWNQSERNILQQNMECRPCSIYGNKPCKFSDFRCLINIKPETVVRRAEELIG